MHRSITYLIAFFFLIGINFTFAQKKQIRLKAFIQLGDEQFVAGYYKNSLQFYDEAISINPNHSYANYRKAECLRLTYEYALAESYYEKVSKLDLANYPQSLFQAALMNKLQGKYRKAIEKFERFIYNTENIDASTFDNKKALFERSLIEIEGCYWAMKQLNDFEFQLEGKPLNSEFNDFAPLIFAQDSMLVITTGRVESLDIKNDSHEAYTKNYCFIKDSNAWKETPLPSGLGSINTKYNEGPGSFSKDRTLYIFTGCGYDGPFCKIYFTEFDNGKWSEPKPCNKNINASNSDNKHPAVSPSGDSLFFVSNRIGGFGQFDLWLSTKSQTGDWEDPENLGPFVNSPFNEIAPFYSSENKSLFFSSDGHKGFGGLDNFFIHADSLFDSRPRNLGNPFNSNLDDCFLVLGKKLGFEASNRLNGFGRFDIYSFINPSSDTKFNNYAEYIERLKNHIDIINYTSEKIQPVLPVELISDEDQDAYEKILSVRMAAFVSDVDMLFTKSDFQAYQNLSLDDKSIVDILYMAQSSEFQKDVLDSIKFSDQKAFIALDENQKKVIEEITNAYLANPVESQSIVLSGNTKNFYEHLKIKDKRQFDRLIAMKIRKFLYPSESIEIIDELIKDNLNLTEISKENSLITPQENEVFERIVSVKLAGFVHGFEIALPETDYKAFDSLSLDDKSLVDMIYFSRIMDLKDSVLESVRVMDTKAWMVLDSITRKNVENFSIGFLDLPVDSTYLHLSVAQVKYYVNLSLGDKFQFDRLVVFRLKQLLNERLRNKEQKRIEPEIPIELVDSKNVDAFERIISLKTSGFIYGLQMMFTEHDYKLWNSLTLDEQSLVDMIYLLRTGGIDSLYVDTAKLADLEKSKLLSENENAFVERISSEYLNTALNLSYVSISTQDSLKYANLIIDQKYKFDRLIAARIFQFLEKQKKNFENYSDISNDKLNIQSMSEAGDIFGKDDMKNYERLLTFRLAAFIHELQIPYSKSDYLLSNNLSIDDQSIVDMMFASRTVELQEPLVLKSVQVSDENNYLTLKSEDKDFVDRIAKLYFSKLNDTLQFVEFENADELRYTNLNEKDKYKFDRLIACKLRNLIFPDEFKKERAITLQSDDLFIKEISQESAIFSEKTVAAFSRIISYQLACYVHNIQVPYIEPDFKLIENLSIDEVSILDMMFKLKTMTFPDSASLMDAKKADIKAYHDLEQNSKSFADRVVNAFLVQISVKKYIDILEGDFSYYSDLKIEEKYKLDRIIISQIKNILYPDFSLSAENNSLNSDEISNTLRTLDQSGLIDKDNYVKYERLLSFRTACYINHLSIPFFLPDYLINNTLTIDDQSIIDMMYALRISNFADESILESTRKSDDSQYARLTDREKSFIDQSIKKFASNPDTIYIKLDDALKEFYSALTIEEKSKLDRVFAVRLGKILSGIEATDELDQLLSEDNLNLKELGLESLISADAYKAFEKMLSFKIACYLYDKPLTYTSPDHFLASSLSLDDLSIFDMIFENHKMALDDPNIIKSIKESDALTYYDLDEDFKSFVDSIANAYLYSPDSILYLSLSHDDSLFYSDLNRTNKLLTDRLILWSISDKLFQEYEISENKLLSDDISKSIKDLSESGRLITKEDYRVYERLLSNMVAGFIYDQQFPLLEHDYKLKQACSIDDLSIIDLIYKLRIQNLSDSLIEQLQYEDQLIFANLRKPDQDFVKRMSEVYTKNIKANFVNTNKQDASQYANLGILEKNKYDRLIFALVYENMHSALGKASYDLFDLKMNTVNCSKPCISGKLGHSMSPPRVTNVKVVLKDQNGNRLCVTSTNQTGDFSFVAAPERGVYKIGIESVIEQKGTFYFVHGVNLECSPSIAQQNNKKEIIYVTDTVRVFSDQRIVSVAGGLASNIYFETNQHVLSMDAMKTLDYLAYMLKSKSGAKLIINAFTDDTGTEIYNKTLSQKRGNSAYKYLTHLGVPESNIQVNALGESASVFPNTSEQQKRLNRRVELLLSE